MDNNLESDYIIKSSCDYEPNVEGLGHEFFKLLNKNKSKIAQYNVDTNETDTFEAILTKTIRASLHLKSKNLAKNDIISLCSYNHTDSCIPFLASQFLGLKVASLDPSLSVRDTAYLLNLVKPKIIFVVPEALELIESSLEEINLESVELVVFGKSQKYEQFSDYLRPRSDEHDFQPESISSSRDTAVIIFSSGTTGFPKGICLNHCSIMWQANNLKYMDSIVNKFNCSSNNMSVLLYYSTLYWISGIVLLSMSIINGTARVVCGKFEPLKAWNIIDKYKVTSMFLAPTQALDIWKAGRPDGIDTSSLLLLVTGGATVSESQMRTLQDIWPGTFVTQGYGQSEVSGAIALFDPNDVRDAVQLHKKTMSCGRLAPGLWSKVVDLDTEQVLGANKQGELRLKGQYLMNGYHNNLDVVRDAYDPDGWLRTGDIVYYDDDQCFYVVDRIKEMLKYRSWHVAPAVLEHVLAGHAAVKMAVVIGVPHEEDGDHPMAVVMLEDNAAAAGVVTAEDLVNYVADRVDDRQRLRGGVKFVDHIPLTPSGKINRQAIKNMFINKFVRV